MGCGGNNPQQNQANPQAMALQASSMPTGSPDSQTNQMIANYQAMKNSGIFNTPQQNYAQQHPIMSRLGNAGLAFAQGLTHQPYLTNQQEIQGNLQNTQLQGMNQINTLPAQLRMMMAMNQMNPNGAPVAGAPPVISTPGGTQAAQGGQQSQWNKTPSGLGYRVVQ